MNSLVALLRALLRALKASFMSDEGRSLTRRLPDRLSLPLLFPMTSPPCDEISEPGRIESAKRNLLDFVGRQEEDGALRPAASLFVRALRPTDAPHGTTLTQTLDEENYDNA